MMVTGNLLSIQKFYLALHLEAEYSNNDIDNMTMYEAEFYLTETMNIKEKRAKTQQQQLTGR